MAATTNPDLWTKTETLRRLRAGAALVRARCGSPLGNRMEIGHRLFPQYADTADAARLIGDIDGDDLSDFDDLKYAARDDRCRRPGAIVHVYSSGTGDYGELEDTCVVWLGTQDDEPALLNVNGVDIRDRDRMLSVNGRA